MEPSHRLATLNFRKTGLVLPFGARRDRFDQPNRFLFSSEEKWVEDEVVDPLLSWEYVDFKLDFYILDIPTLSSAFLKLFKQAKPMVHSGKTSMVVSTSIFMMK